MRLINIIPGRALAAFLVLLPFALVLSAYAIGSDIRLTTNPSDKLLPAPSTIGDTVVRLTTEGDRRTGDILFWLDTWASLKRLGLGIGISASLGLLFGLLIGLLPLVRSTLNQFVAVLSMIPPLALLPILFIVFGLGELSKVVLIVVGTLPFIIRDLSQRTIEIPQELLVKAQTLGASSWVIAIRVALPQVMPRLIGLALYRLDINFRESAVIGIVGAGGIGATLNTAIDRYEYDSAGAILLIIIALVMVAEYGSSYLRKFLQ